MYKYILYVFLLVFLISCGNEADFNNEEKNTLNVQEVSVFQNKEIKDRRILVRKAYKNNQYIYDLKTENNLDADKYYIYSGDLPKGLELNEDTGSIQGIPEETGVFDFEIAIQPKESKELVIKPANISIDDNIVLYKDIRSFIDISKSDKSSLIQHDTEINLSSDPALPPKAFFQFYEEDVTTLKVCKQGYVKLDSSPCSFTSDFENKKVIAPFADPELTLDANSSIHYQIRGMQPRRMLIIQYKNLHRTTDPKASQNFEMIIYEDSNRITFLYGLSYSSTNSTQKHLGTNAIIGVSGLNKQYIISPENEATPPKPIIFNGNVITLKAPDAGITQYKKTIDSNIVSDFIDISRYLEEADDCTSDSQCPLTDRCLSNKCAARILTNTLMYDNFKEVRLPFSFNFYGSAYTDINIHENGYLFFDQNSYDFYTDAPNKKNRNTPIPVNRMEVDNVIAGMFANIDLKSVRGGNILYHVIGEEPNRKAVFLYDKVRVLDPIDSEPHICTFEIVLHETSNIIEYIYGTNNSSPICNGITSSIGIKKDNAEYVSVTSNNPVLQQGKSLVFVPNDVLASSYTWTGIGNEIRNSNATDGTQGKFLVSPFNWALIDDQPASIFVRYDQVLTTDQWIDTSAGTRLNLSDDDYVLLPNPSGKSFNLYGLPRTQYYVQSNGGITVDSLQIAYNEPSNLNYDPNAQRPNTGIFAYWNDLNPSRGGAIRYLYTQKNGKDVVVVEWDDIPVYNNNGSNTFQIQMYKNGQKYFCYRNINSGGGSSDYVTGVRNSKGDYREYTNSLNSLALTNNCIAYNPIYRYPSNHIVASRSTVTTEDSGEQNIPIGFSYDFQGQTFNNVTVSSNGVVRFEDSVSEDILDGNTRLSNSNAYDKSLNLFWDDLDPRENTNPSSGVFYTTAGTAPDRFFIVSYNAVPHDDVSGTSRISAQVILRENTNNIEFCYGELFGSYSRGDSATIGIRNTSTEFTELSYNSAILESNKCFTWIPPIPGHVEARNIFVKETNADFIDIPVEHTGFGDGEYLEDLYNSGGILKPYSIYDLTSQDYTFTFKGREYKQLFVDAKGAVSFGNDNDAAIVTAPMWGDIFYNSDISSKTHPSLQEPYENVENDFMWIANADGNSLSKINTHNGTVSGPYPVGKSPSRTAVGFDGSVWVGNRNSSNVTKLDRNGNIICTVNLRSGCAPRGVALDKDENAWIGCGAWKNATPDGWVYKIRDTHSKTGDRCEIIDMRAPGDTSDPSDPKNRAFKGHNKYGHYGFAIDKRGILWSSPGTHGYHNNYFLRIDTNKAPSELGFYKRFRGHSSNSNQVGNTWVSRAGVTGGHDGVPFKFYGIAIDLNGDLWLGNWSSTNSNRALTKAHYDEVADQLIFEIFPSYQHKGVSNARGVAIDANGYIYVAYSGTHNVGKFAQDGTPVALFYLNSNNGPEGAHNCSAPTGIGVDGDGDVWANCLSSSRSEELNVDTGQELKSLPTGQSPYCYSDNTGFNLRNIVTDVKPAKYYAGITDYESYPNESSCITDPENAYRYRKLIVQWRDVRMKTETNHGYTEATFEMIFDNGYRYSCDLSQVKVIKPMNIKYVYGAIQGNKYDQKTGKDSIITLKSLYSDYNHVIGDEDAGTINSGSKFIITSEK